MTLPTFSQSRLSDSTVCVPRQTIINALKMKNDCELYKITSRDSIALLTKIVSSQDSLIITKTETNRILTDNTKNLTETIILKDNIIGEKDKVIKKVKSNNKKIVGGGVLLILLALLI